MHMQQKPVDDVKMLTLIALLSKYDLFHISTSDGEEFNATEIVNTKFGSLEFRRCFATSLFSNSYITKIQACAENDFICYTKNKEYRISALHNRPQKYIKANHREWKDVLDLMDSSYISNRFGKYKNENDELIFVVDPYLLGELNLSEQSQIQTIIDVDLSGYSINMQRSRTVCFIIKEEHKEINIYAGLFDIEYCNVMTKKFLFTESDVMTVSENIYNKFQSLLEML